MIGGGRTPFNPYHNLISGPNFGEAYGMTEGGREENKKGESLGQ